MLSDFLTLLYPAVCQACGKSLYKAERCICAHCHYHLPKTNFHQSPNNPVERLFLGRTQIQAASALYLFNKGSKVQQLIHQLKYRGKKEIGTTLGHYYGNELRSSKAFAAIDVVVPVPLHKSKLKKRGYNQSEYFARGLAESLNVAYNDALLFRIRASQSQTRKSRYARWKNVEHVFKLHDSESIAGKHILLADDVITTGSTLEACANKILEIPQTKVSVVTIASTLF